MNNTDATSLLSPLEKHLFYKRGFASGCYARDAKLG